MSLVCDRPRRSILCVPAGDDHKLRKALHAGADEVVVDLEDAVALGDKDRAREQLTAFDWPDHGPAVAIRVNAARTPWCHRDLEMAVSLGQVSSIVLPKVESGTDVGFAERLLDGLESAAGRPAPLAIEALVETPSGVLCLSDVVARNKRLRGVIIGYADLAASLGRNQTTDPAAWRGVQDTVLLHTAAAGIAAVDGPYLGVADDRAFRTAVDTAAAAGFQAKWVIHPRQVAHVTEAFTPSATDVDHARRVLTALEEAAGSGQGAAVVDGALVDEAMAVAARRVLGRISE
ncbi:CoA ester lyase [Saccharopolyspora terrae]|uniref:CoA ester lyase n=1 Tax=Saccharopolyspora terrae TaxID=2530384 RepID=A0A4V2YAK4_9PSEU|nr:CoA ester lyase [Saccharopolyspora terrae]